MELLLNLAWVSVCLLLIACWVRSLRSTAAPFQWTAVIALCLLLVLLFPAISMTDDLMAMSAPAQSEHVLARHDLADLHTSSIALVDTVPLISLALLGPAQQNIYSARVRPRTFAAAVLAGSIRQLGVRPPTPVLL